MVYLEGILSRMQKVVGLILTRGAREFLFSCRNRKVCSASFEAGQDELVIISDVISI